MTIKTECPRQNSDMTPCYLKDGDNAVSDDCRCVGCDRGIRWIMEQGEMTVSADAADVAEIIQETLAK